MMTWQIMIGMQLISILVSLGVIISFMLKKEPFDIVTDKGENTRININTEGIKEKEEK